MGGGKKGGKKGGGSDGIGQPLPPWMRKGGKKGGGKDKGGGGGGGGGGGKGFGIGGMGPFGMNGMGMNNMFGMGMPPFGMMPWQMPMQQMPMMPQGPMMMMPNPAMQQMSHPAMQMPMQQQMAQGMQMPGTMGPPMPGQQTLGAAPPEDAVAEQPRKIIIRRAETSKEPSLPELSPRDEPMAKAPVVEPRGDRAPPSLPPPLADGTRQVLVMIPRPGTASSDGFGELDDLSVKIPEFGVTIPLPEWYREAQDELQRPPPSWPPQVLIDVGAELHEDGEPAHEDGAGPRRGSRASHDTKSSADTTTTDQGKKLSPLQAAIQARQRAAETTSDAEAEDAASVAGSQRGSSKRRASMMQSKRSKLFPYLLVVFFANHVWKNGLKTIKDWSSKMQTHFEDTCQMQMRNCISWLARALRTFARTLMVDSHRGLELAPSRGSGLKMLDIGGDDLTSRQRLAIRAYVLFDILLTGVESPPQPLTRFLSRLAQPEGIMLYVPKTYFTESERSALEYDPRGGIYSQPRSRQHQQLVAGFLIPRALLGGLFTSWVRTLEGDASIGAERGKRNLQTLAALLYLGFQKKYELLSSVHDIPGLATATSERLTQFGLDKRLVSEVGELVEKLVVFFTQPDAHMSVVARVQSNPFTAGNIKIAPRDRGGEGAEMAVQADDVQDEDDAPPVSGRKSIVDRIKRFAPSMSDAASTVQSGAGRFRASVAAGRARMAKQRTVQIAEQAEVAAD